VIRELRDDDIPQLAGLWRELRPDAVHSENGLRHLIASFPPRAEAAHWVAGEEGVVAWCFAHRRWRRASSERNGPMLAVNRRLGYGPFVERRGYLRENDTRSSSESGR